MTILDIVVLGVAIAVVAFVLAFYGRKRKREPFEMGGGNIIFGNDLPGNPVGGIKDAVSCARTCKDTPGCAYYTWLGPGSPIPNTCWLKSKEGEGRTMKWNDSYTGKPDELPKTPDKPVVTHPILEYHNMVRAKPGANRLDWDDGIAAHAQTWANSCNLNHGSSDGASYGQNLAYGHRNPVTLQPDPIAAATDWYNEYKVIQASNDITKGGHFTAMVWKDTKKMGCGISECSLPDWGGKPGPYIVCEYDPPGNISWLGQEQTEYAKKVQVNPSY